MKALSIYENDNEILEIGKALRWIEEGVEDYDLLGLFEGDPDYLDLGPDNHLYFFTTEFNGEKYLIHTGEMPWDKKYVEMIMDWYTPEGFKSWKRIDDNIPTGSKENPVLWFRGSSGYWYSVYVKK